MVYVLSKTGQPLMPTENHAKVRVLLKQQKAKIVHSCPFTIQLLYDSTDYTQPVSLGIDAGSRHIGVSATTETKVLYEADVTLRNDIVDLLSTRREARRTRRSRKTRYRKPRFNNRTRKDGWLAPSIQQKVDTHLTTVRKVTEILPVNSITVETASFDIQKIKNPDIAGTGYQQGEQLDFWNVREYVLFRDGHKCQCCKGKSKDPVLNVHHIESRKTGGNAPNNLITLCETCHKGYHNGTVSLPKDHFIDARCISGHPDATSGGTVFYQKKVRCHNRQIHKQKILKGGIRKRNQAPYLVKGFRLFEKVKYHGKQYFIFGRRSSGFFDIRTLDGTKVNKGSVSCKKIRSLDMPRSYLTEERKVIV